MKWKAFVALAIVVAGLFGGFPIGTVKAQVTITETQITTNTAHQASPAVYGDIIVWTDERNIIGGYGGRNIYMYDLSTGTETGIAPIPFNQVLPAVYGDIIVWQDGRNTWDIYMYDLSTSTETPITTNPATQADPAVYGDIIVWEDKRNGWDNGDIYMYDLSTGVETQVTTNPANVLYPAVYGDIIVWTDNRNRNGDIDMYGNWDIYMYDLSTGAEAQVTTNTAHQAYPAVYGDIIVWEDWRNGYPNRDIYMYDLSTGVETQVTTDTADQAIPAVYGDIIVWTDNRTGNYDIYMGRISSAPPPTPPTEQAENIESIVADPSNIPRSDFDGATDKVKDNRRKALINRLEAVIIDIQTAEASSDPSTINTAYQSAIDQLNSILDKTDGCSERGTPDTQASGYTPDWIITSESQALIDPLIRDLIAALEALLIP